MQQNGHQYNRNNTFIDNLSSNFRDLLFPGDDAYPGGTWPGAGHAAGQNIDLSPIEQQPPVLPQRPVVPASSPDTHPTAFTAAGSAYLPGLHTVSSGTFPASSSTTTLHTLTTSSGDNNIINNPQYCGSTLQHHQLPSVETLFSGAGTGNTDLQRSTQGPQTYLEHGDQHHLETPGTADHRHQVDPGSCGLNFPSPQQYQQHHSTQPPFYADLSPNYNLESLSVRVKPEPGEQQQHSCFDSQRPQYPPAAPSSSWGSPSSSDSQLTGVGEPCVLQPGPSTSSGAMGLPSPATPSTSYTPSTPQKKPHPRQGYRRASDGDPRKERRREQNRRAALKCRNKKKKEWDEVQKDYDRLESHNAEMQEKIEKLRREKRELCELLRQHKLTCSLDVDLPPPSP